MKLGKASSRVVWFAIAYCGCICDCDRLEFWGLMGIYYLHTEYSVQCFLITPK